jgi:glycerate-2-kinase
MEKIKNLNALATNDRRLNLLKIAEAGYEAIDTKAAVARAVVLAGDQLTIAGQTYDLTKVNRLFVYGVGKCALDAAEVLEQLLGERLTGGRVIDLRCNPNLKKIVSCEGDHPFPTERNIEHTKNLITDLEELTATDLAIFIVSGGGSTLICQPEGFDCEAEAAVVKLLFEKGATIQELNTVRKHLSLARGGQLAKAAFPAQVVTIIFSDVPGDDLGFIASGPFIKDTTTVLEARMILERYDTEGKFDSLREKLLETPKEEKYFANIANQLIVSNRLALEAMMAEATRRGYKSELKTVSLVGEAELVASQIVHDLHATTPGTALFYGGETTVVVKGKGQGGRNLTLALAALPEVMIGELLGSFASDGHDNTPAAGAFADSELMALATERGLSPREYLDNSDSFGFFHTLGYDVETGPTGSNVSDLIVALKN